MKKFNYVFIISLLLLSSCGTIKDGFSLQKKDSVDEFLVEKKSPLKLPPEFDQLPLPKSENNSEINNQEDDSQLKEILTQSKTINESNKSSENQKNRSLEDNLLKKIRK
ncbi:DUF3035 domain-containing protein [Candidatus Pelagibacter sp.]|nr:DUF3035 domain-containing protein [Candidatus Pelagibacter sp.]